MQPQQQDPASFDISNLSPELLQWHLQQQQQAAQQAASSSSSSSSPSQQQQQQQQQGGPLAEPMVKQESNAGPIRTKTAASAMTASPPSGAADPAAPSSSSSAHASTPAAGSSSSSSKKIQPVRAACLFCRARKSRCDGKQPCHNCINRGREDDCVFTVSRRGGKPKPKPNQSQEEANLELHLKRLFNLAQLPQRVRIPGAVPQLADAQPDGQAQASNGQQQQQSSPASASSALPFGDAQTAPPQQSDPQLQQQQTQFDSQMFTQAHPQYNNYGSSDVASASPMQQPSHNVASQWNDPMTAALFNAMNQGYDVNNSASAPFAQATLPHQQPQQQFSGSMGPDAFSQPQPQQQAQPWQVQQAMSSSSSAAPIFEDTADVYTILLGYYNSLYRFIPVFLPPQYIHQMATRLSPESPFILALRAILPLLHHGDAEENSNNSQAFAAGFGVGPGNSGLTFASPERKRELSERANYYERRASDAIEMVLERAESHMQGDTNNSQLTNMGSTFGVIQALAVLCVYHYGNGRALKARLKADQALGLAMAKGLHRLQKPNGTTDASAQATTTKSSFVSSSSDPFGDQTIYSDLPDDVTYEMKKRVWWTCWSSSLWCSYNTAIVPTIRADDTRVRTEMPKSIDSTVWPASIKSLQSLLLIQERVLALANLKEEDGGEAGGDAGAHASTPTSYAQTRRPASTVDFGSTAGDTPTATDASGFASLSPHATRSEVLDSMLEIDKQLQEQIARIESDEQSFKELCAEPPSINLQGQEALSRVEEDLALYLRRSAAIQLYTSSLTLHLGQAFQGASLFERKLCFLNTVTENDTSAACQVPMPDAFASYFDQSQQAQQALQQQQQQQQPPAPSADQRQWDEWIRSTAPPQQTTQDLFARGPFLPKDSLRRCVHASKRLLEIARSKRKEPNPFNACSFVLISFTLLMQALAVSGGDSARGEHEGEDDDLEDNADQDMDVGGEGDGYAGGDFDLDDFLSSEAMGGSSNGTSSTNQMAGSDAVSTNGIDLQARSRGLLHSAQGAAALGTNGNGGSGDGLGNNYTDGESLDTLSSDQLRKRQRLMEIWSRVREAHATLKELSRYWKMVEPMADEVSLCLETSQLLL